MTRLHTLGLALLMALSASALAQDKAAPAAAKPAVATSAASPATTPPAASAAPAATPTAVPAAAAPPAASAAAAKPAAAPSATAPAVALPAVAPAPSAATAPAAKPAAAPAPVTAEKSAAPAKKRMVKRKPKAGCTKLDDPWDNVCQIAKNAELACKDLPDGKRVAKASKKGKAAPATTENRRKQCVDNYMRNV